MNRKEFTIYFQEDILPYIKEKYEKDGEIDIPARREAWNNMIDCMIEDGLLSEKAGNWELPDEFER